MESRLSSNMTKCNRESVARIAGGHILMTFLCYFNYFKSVYIPVYFAHPISDSLR